MATKSELEQEIEDLEAELLETQELLEKQDTTLKSLEPAKKELVDALYIMKRHFGDNYGTGPEDKVQDHVDNALRLLSGKEMRDSRYDRFNTRGYVNYNAMVSPNSNINFTKIGAI